MLPKKAATLTARKMSSKHTFWLVLSTTPLLASLKKVGLFECLRKSLKMAYLSSVHESAKV